MVYTKVPLGEHRDKEFPGQRKAHFVSNLQSQIGKPASRGCLEIRAREMLCILKDPRWLSGAGAEGLPQSGSDRDYVRDSSQA